MNRLLIALLAACAVAAAVLAPDGWRWPSMCGVLVAGATLATSFTMQSWPGRLTVYLIGGLVTVAATTLWHSQSRAYGVTAAAVATILYPAARLAEPYPHNDTRRRQFLGLLKGSAIGATIVVAALVAIGLYERNRASFAIRYGEQVTVTVADWCVGMSGGGCVDSTWTIDGRTYTGTLYLGSTELAGTPTEAWTVPGDDRAYAAGHDSATPDGLEAIGLVPRWLGLLVLLVMIGYALPARVWRRAGRSVGTAARTSTGDGR